MESGSATNVSSSFQRLHSLDLLNIEYDDILHLYRGFRRAEGMLQEKTKDFETLRKTHKDLRDFFEKMSDKLKSLEDLTDSTLRFELEIRELQLKNQELAAENQSLLQLKGQAEETLQQKVKEEEKGLTILRAKKEEIDTLEGQMNDLKRENFTLRQQLEQKDSDLTALERRSQELFVRNDHLEEINFKLSKKVDKLENKLRGCDQDLGMASEQLLKLSEEVSHLAAKEVNKTVSITENAMLKRDIRRLLKLLENYPSANGFLLQWKDSGDDGMSYIGPLTYSETMSSSAQLKEKSLLIQESRRILESINESHHRPLKDSNDFPVPYRIQVLETSIVLLRLAYH